MTHSSPNREEHKAGEISPNVISKMLEVIPAGATVLEIGTGFSTIELAEVFEVISIEDNPRWHRGVSRLIHAPLIKLEHIRNSTHSRFRDFDAWYDPEILERELEGVAYDAILIDGPAGSKRRPGFYHYRSLFNLKVPIFIDDVHRSNDLRMAVLLARKTKASALEIFDTETGGKVFARILP